MTLVCAVSNPARPLFRNAKRCKNCYVTTFKL
jgi:hypothetical protein